MTDDTDDETEAGPANDETEIVTQSAGVAPLAWSDATGSQPVVDYAEPRWRSILPKVLAPAAAVAVGAVVAVMLVHDHHQAPPAPTTHSAPPPSQAAPQNPPQAAPPVVLPTTTVPQTPAVSATEVSTAFTVRGRTGNAFEACYFIPDNDGYPVSDPEQPGALGLVGLSPQWADITGKLHRLGINIQTNTDDDHDPDVPADGRQPVGPAARGYAPGAHPVPCLKP
jgi:hypothetical protein